MEEYLQEKLRLAKENIDNFDDKLQLILNIREELEKNPDALETEYASDLSKKYARYYMEIEKYYIAPSDRLQFINICLNLQVDLVSSPNGIVSGDFFIDQFEKLIAEDYEIASKIAQRRETADRITNLAFAEFMEIGAAGKLPDSLNDLNWGKFKDYYFPKALELGWDGYYSDGGKWEPSSTNKSNASESSANQPQKTESATIGSHDSVPASGSNNGGCYIATAVYGSYDCPEVWTLRRFRDLVLAQSWYGKCFIKIYYTLSPILVQWLGTRKWFQNLGRNQLNKIVHKLKLKGFDDSPYND